MAISDIVETLLSNNPRSPQQPLPTLTPDSIKRRRLLAEAMMKDGMDYSPVASPWQGAARLAQGALGGMEAGKADKDEREGVASGNAAMVAALAGLGGGGASAAPALAAATASPTATPSFVKVSGVPDREGFVSSLMPSAIAASEATGVDPRIIVGQAALESGWGKSAPGNNYFGIKSHGQPGGNTLATTEVINGQPVKTQASFRAYASPAESVAGYADFINKNPRYAALKGAQGIDAQLAALQSSGYATDPAYGAKVGAIARSLSSPQRTQVASADPTFIPRGMMGFGASAQLPQEATAAAQPRQAPQMAQDGSGLPSVAGGAQPAMQMPQQVAQLRPEQVAQAAASPQVQQAAQAAAQTPQGQQLLRQSQSAPLAAIMAAMSNPWVGEGQKAMLMMIAKEKMGSQYGFTTAGDTMYRTNSRTGEVTPITSVGKPVAVGADQRLVDPNTGRVIVNPTGGNTTDQKDYERAVSQGYKGTLMDYQTAMANAKRPVNKTEGTIPPGYRANRDADGNINSLELIPGSKEAKADGERVKGATSAANLVADAIDRIEKRMGETVFPTTGGIGNLASKIPGTAAHDIANLVDTVKANTSIQTLNAMRQQSPTGGALGAVTEGEHRLLAASVASLAQSQGEKQFRENLARVRKHYSEIVHGANKSGGPEIGTVESGYKFKGGNPGDPKNWERVQ